MINVIVVNIVRAGMLCQKLNGTRMKTMAKEAWHRMLCGWRRHDNGRDHCVLPLGREQCC
eukprot:8281743-Pyramimonas_sp.AAC.1